MTDDGGPAVPNAGAADHQVAIRLLSPQAQVPRRAYAHDAAYDLCAAADVTLPPQGRAVVGTGVALGMPPDMAALTLPRSGLAARHGLTIVNAPGLIDPGYRGEIAIVLLNTDTRESFTVHAGDRIAQLLFLPVTAVAFVPADDIGQTERGERGFGSSGRGGAP